MTSQHYARIARATLGSTQYTAGRGESSIMQPSIQHGVNDSLFANTIASTQVSKAVNFDLTKDGHLKTRGGSQKLSDTAMGSTGAFPHEHTFTIRNSDGTLTRVRLAKSGTVLYKYNTSTGVWDSIRTGLSQARPCMVDFQNAAGTDVVLYCDGTNFLMYDNTSFTDILSNFTAGNATSAPRFLFVAHNVVFAAGVKEDPDVIFWCDPLSPNTDWPSQGYAIVEGGASKITGIGGLRDYVVVTTLDGIHVLSGRSSATFSFFQVNRHYGCTSHWSIVSEGGYLYFVNADGPYIGTLMALESDGMEVTYIGGNMQNTFSTITSGYWDNVVGVYHGEKKQIYWTFQSSGQNNPDKVFIYSTVLSHPELSAPLHGLDMRFVWAGYYEGLDFNSIAVMRDANGKDFLSVVDSSGLVYTMHTGYKDARDVGEETGTDVEYEIRPREETFGRMGMVVRSQYFFPTLYQKHNGGFSVQFLINRTRLFPSSPVALKFTGNIPYWNDGNDPLVTSVWGGTVWSDQPILSARVGIKQKCYSIIPIITSSGENDKEEGVYIGHTMTYQRLPHSQGRAV